MAVVRYALDNAAGQAEARFSVLEGRYDAVSRTGLAATGIGPGWRCLEVGGGGGSIARWLAGLVTPGGHVTVTDIAPEWMGSLAGQPCVSVVRHDVVRDELPEEEFDLVHARLVLLHLPERHEVLGRLVGALKPGGHLVVEDFDCGWVPVLRAPGREAADLFDRVHAAFLGALGAAGADPLFGRKAFGAVADAGLDVVSATTHAEAWAGGSAGVDLHRANTEQLADEIRNSGVTEPELRAFWALLRDPAFAVNSYPLVTVHGRRP